MLECPQINKNSKLYQKFLEKKCKKEGEQSKLSNEQVGYSRKRYQSTFKLSKDAANAEQSSIDGLLHTFGDENQNTSNISTNKLDSKQENHINNILKRQLERKRNPIVMKAQTFEQYELSVNNKIQIKLQKDYLSAQNQKLKQKIAQQTQKNQSLQRKLSEQTIKSQILSSELQMLKRQISSKQFSNSTISLQKYQEMAKQMEKLKEQNHLAKDYLYKLTLKLYQSQQQNQKLKKQIEYMKGSLPHPSQTMLPMETSRHREFKNYKEDDKKNPIKSQAIPTSNLQAMPKQKSIRIEEIQRQLLELNVLKVFNGKNRRRKIQLQRQLEELNFS